MLPLQSLLDNPQMSFDPLNFIGILATVVVSIYIFKSDLPFEYVKERHEKLIFPLFDLLEPLLYRDYDVDTIKKACFIIEENKSFIDGKLLSIYHNCKNTPCQESFIDLCTYIDRAFDKSCRKLKLKRRSINYRINNRQYRSNWFLAGYIVGSIFIFLLVLFSSFAGLLYVFSLLYSFFSSANETTQIVFALLGCVLILAICKYAENHL